MLIPINTKHFNFQFILINKMQSKQTQFLLKSNLNGWFHKGNFVWAGAMNICWNTLSDEVIKQPLKLKVKGNHAKHMIDNFANSPFSKEDLSRNSYYTKAGFGQDALSKINKELKQKFPNKSFQDIQMKLESTDLISYAYFVKQVQYLHPFSIQPSFYFEGQLVKGFKAKSNEHYRNIRICKYIDSSKFIIRLLVKQNNQQLFIVKGFKHSLPQSIIEAIQQNSQSQQRLKKQQKFKMPIVDFNVKRKYTQLIGAPILNQKFRQSHISVMFEGIKFRIDEVGAKVENQALMVARKQKSRALRSFIVDSSFWIVMKQKDCHPYFVAQINNAGFMIKSSRI